MRCTGKKAAHQESGKPLCETENGSVLISSFKLKKGSKVACSGKSKPISDSYFVNTSTQPKALVTHPSRKMKADRSITRKFMGRRLKHKEHDKKLSKKMDSLNQQGISSPVIGFEDNDDNAGAIASGEQKKRKKRRRRKHKVEPDEPSRLQRRSRYLLIKMKQEQNLIDAYSGEGWKGQSREKIKPEKELIRAKKQILKCKLGLRDVIRQLDSLSTIGCIEDSVMAPDGSVSHEHIFCAKCKMNEVSQDNDIVLCDGRCNCAFHQKCLNPPLKTENIPPGEQGWLCKFCDCRIEIIEAINAHLGTHFSLNSDWEDMFKEEAAFPDGREILLNPEDNWPSDDSEDDDYDPERRENSMSGAETNGDASDDASSSTSLGWSSDGEVLSEGRSGGTEGMDLKHSSVFNNLDSDANSEGEILFGRRQRRAVDYKKLYDEMFGKDMPTQEQLSEDEDWGPRKRRRKEKESDAASTLMTLHKSEHKGKRVDTAEMEGEVSQLQIRRSLFRIPSFAVEKLRQAFAENELPSRTIKEKLAKELGLELRKVSKWFKNARYLALKSRKAGRAERICNSSPNLSGNPRPKMTKDENAALATMTDTSAETRICTLKNLKEALQKKKTKWTGSSLNQGREKGTSSSHYKFREIGTEHNDDVSLKKLLKARTRKRVKKVSTKAFQLAEAELERVCRAKDKLEVMKQNLTTLQNSKARKLNRVHLLEQCVILVPVAEVREKF